MMLNNIKNRIDKELATFISYIDQKYSLRNISPLLFKSIKDFVLRDGKRIRPILFVIGYLGFAKKEARDLYRSALSIELLHDFMLIHDDIIDKSDTRRGKPSMHKILNNYLAPYKNIKFNGQDLSIIVGDVMHALAIDAFVSIQESPERKEQALKKFIEATLYTGSGEFIELISGLLDIEKITKQAIYKIYDYKTAYYTFSIPLSTGALLAGAKRSEAEKLSESGIYIGRAFQIKDDILGMFGNEKTTGKSTLSDLQEAKRTLLVWYAYRSASRKEKSFIKKVLEKGTITTADLMKVRTVMTKTKTLCFARGEITALEKKAKKLLLSSAIKPLYKKTLLSYTRETLTI